MRRQILLLCRRTRQGLGFGESSHVLLASCGSPSPPTLGGRNTYKPIILVTRESQINSYVFVVGKDSVLTELGEVAPQA